MVCFVFLFKQKTAYEMRISDWSSDVCSSDLLVDVRQHDHKGDGLAIDFGDADQIFEDDVLQLLADIGDLAVGQRHEAPIVRPCVVEIGRASCRERVCQYV